MAVNLMAAARSFKNIECLEASPYYQIMSWRFSIFQWANLERPGILKFKEILS